MRWYLIIILTCIFLMTNGIEYLFMCLLTICVSSLELYLFKSFAHFKVFIYLFIFGHTVCLLLLLGSKQGLPVSALCLLASFSLQWLLLLQSTGPRECGHRPRCSAACGTFRTRDWTHVTCIGGWILNRCTTREAQVWCLISRNLWIFQFYFCCWFIN